MPADCFEVFDNRFRRLFVAAAEIEKLFTGCRWAEGPAYFPAARSLVWSDIPNDRMLRLDECSGAVSVFRCPAGCANGNTVDRAGRLCHLRTRDDDGFHEWNSTEPCRRSPTTTGAAAQQPQRRRREIGRSIWFTDPTYGIDSENEGLGAERTGRKFRLSRRTGRRRIDRGRRRLHPAQRDRLLAGRANSLHRRTGRTHRPTAPSISAASGRRVRQAEGARHIRGMLGRHFRRPTGRRRRPNLDERRRRRALLSPGRRAVRAKFVFPRSWATSASAAKSETICIFVEPRASTASDCRSMERRPSSPISGRLGACRSSPKAAALSRVRASAGHRSTRDDRAAGSHPAGAAAATAIVVAQV